MAKRLEKLEIRTVRNLLFYPPFRYNDFSHTVPIGRIVPGTTVTVEGDVQSIKNIFTKTGKKLQEAVVADQSGMVSVIWFNQIYLPKIIHAGDRISLSGTIGFFGNKLVMESPDYEIRGSEEQTLLHTGRFVPVYSETAGISSKWLRGRIAFLLSIHHTFLTEFIPRTILQQNHLMSISDALSSVHFPTSITQAESGRRRLAFDELFFLQLTSTLRKKQWEQEQHAPVFQIHETHVKNFMVQLPFVLTDGQQKSVRHICADIKRSYPMNRLLEGDVGSGKTVVAAFAMYMAYKNGYTAVMMAPTQILAEQHYHTIQQLLKPFGITVSLILGNSKGHPFKGSPSNIIIGTHALLQEKVEFNNVGLVIIDEQQRFGVSQRTVIRNKGSGTITPHFLTMTATPIPRTLALTVYGNLDLSVLSEMPKGRTPIKTWVVPREKRASAYAWVRKELKTHDTRIFLVCPFIEESESMITIKAAKKEFEYLQKDVFPDISMGLLHGKLKAKEKTAVLDAFRDGSTRILVTTPVVEVGIDIKEASIMIIEGSDRFGLSQLHQLRGRVGRGELLSYCLLFTESTEEKTLERLKILEKVKNGPELAEYDLMLRGEGDVFGMRQHGLPPLTIASLKDTELVEEAQQAVRTIIDTDPNLSQFPLLREQVEKGTIGEGIQD
jgi:ATP-dependent DNA helicase RecG